MKRALLAVLLLATPAAAADEVIEEVEAIAEPAAQENKVATLIGYFHSATVHMPIAWLLLLVLVDGAALLMNRGELAKLGLVLLAVTTASFVPAVITGLQRLEHLGLEPEAMAPAVLHRNVMFVCGGAMLVALLFRWRFRHNLVGALKYAYLALVAAAAALVITGGHMGGKMIFGELPL